jgi:hypothetical protein
MISAVRNVVFSQQNDSRADLFDASVLDISRVQYSYGNGRTLRASEESKH